MLRSQGAARYENGGVYVGEFANDVRCGWGERPASMRFRDCTASGGASLLARRTSFDSSRHADTTVKGLLHTPVWPPPCRHALLPKQRQVRGRVGG